MCILHDLPSAAPASRFGDVELRREQGIALKAGRELSLTKTEFRLLCEFADHVGMVLSRDQLLERVWGYEYLGDSRLVDAHVRRLRVKIEDQPDDPKLIVTARGIGYRLPSRAEPPCCPELGIRYLTPSCDGCAGIRRGLWPACRRQCSRPRLAEVADDHEVEGEQVGQFVPLDGQIADLGDQPSNGIGREVVDQPGVPRGVVGPDADVGVATLVAPNGPRSSGRSVRPVGPRRVAHSTGSISRRRPGWVPATVGSIASRCPSASTTSWWTSERRQRAGQYTPNG